MIVFSCLEVASIVRPSIKDYIRSRRRFGATAIARMMTEALRKTIYIDISNAEG